MPKKQPSGYQNRKKAAAKAEKLANERLAVTHSWAASSSDPYSNYRGSTIIDPNGPPQQIPIYGSPPPTFERGVQAAILQLEQGAFWAAAYLWDGMLRDDRVAAKSEERIDRLIGSPLEFEPAKDTAQGRKIAEDLEEQFPEICPPHQLLRLIGNAMAMSVGIAQIVTVPTETGTNPTIKVWNNRYLRFDQTINRYMLVTQNRGEIALEPGDPEWIIYEPYGPLGWLTGAKIRSLALPWLIRFWTRNWWARHQEVHGQPLRLGVIPADRDPADEKLFLAQLSRIGHEAVIRLPQGVEGNRFDVRLLEASSNTWEGFERLLAHCDDSIAITWLGQSQSTKGQGGLGSQENAGESTITRLIRKDGLIADVIRKQILRKWTQDNYGNADMCPKFRWLVEPPEDETKTSKVDLAIGQALLAFKNAGAPLDVRAFLEERGYPLLSEEEEAAQKQQAIEEAQQAMQTEQDAEDATDPAESENPIT